MKKVVLFLLLAAFLGTLFSFKKDSILTQTEICLIEQNFAPGGKKPLMVECRDSEGDVIAWGAACIYGHATCIENDCPR